MLENILVIVDSDFPGDVRVDKQVSALSKKYKVVVICRSTNAKELKNVTILTMPWIKYRWVRGVVDVINASVWLHLSLIYTLLFKCCCRNFEIIHVHDLPLCKTALIFFRRKKVIVDLHENYPEAVAVWFSQKRNVLVRLKNKLLFNYTRWNEYELQVCEAVDIVISVVDEMKQKLISKGINFSKIEVISNMETKNFVNDKIDCYNSSFSTISIEESLLYLGHYGPHRGLDDVIVALHLLKQEGINIRFNIAGIPNNPDTQQSLVALVHQLGLEDSVKFYGAVPFSCYYYLMSRAKINIIPHKSNGHTNNTIPHKLFQSFLSKRPVLVSSCPPLKRYAGDLNLGTVFEADNPQDLARQIKAIYAHYPAYLQKAERAFEAVYNGPYSWEEESKKLLAIYERLLSKK